MKKRILIMINIVLAVMTFYGCTPPESDLKKSHAVIFYYLDERKVIDYSGQKEIDWSKIVKTELKEYDIQQKTGNKLLIVNDNEIGYYDYIKHKKEIIYQEKEKRYAVASTLLVDNKMLYINQRDIKKNYDENSVVYGILYYARLIKYDLDSKKKTVIDENSSYDQRIAFNRNGDIVYNYFNSNKKEWYEKRLYTKSGKMYAYRDKKIVDADTNKEVNNISLDDFESVMSTTKDGRFSFKISVKSYDFNATKLARILKVKDNETGVSETLDEGEMESGINSDYLYDLRGVSDILVIQF